MKKYSLIILTIFFALSGHAQVYYPMFGYHHTWYIDDIEPHSGPSTENDNLIYKIMDASGDTIINNRHYFKAKLYWDNFQYSFDTTLFFREDTALQKVWLLLNDTTKEKLLYDYSLKRGDSIYLDFDFQDTSIIYYTRTGWYHVDSVNTTSIFAGQRKTLYLSNPNNLYYKLLFSHYPELVWIEQIGSTIMPDYLQHNIDANAYRWGFYWNFFYIMLCSFDDSTKIYHNPTFNNSNYIFTDADSCSLIRSSGINDLEKLGMSINISPNPSQDVITIYAKLSKPSLTVVEIFSVTGIKLFSSQVNSFKNNFESTINTSALPSGIYFVRLSSSNVISMSKFVKY